MPRRARPSDDRGSAPAEFVMVGGLLALLVVAVLQLALALHVRTTLLDAAAEGARHAALADGTGQSGIERTRQLIGTAIGSDYARDVRAGIDVRGGDEFAVITVRAPLPIAGLLGIADGIEVTAHAPLETVAE